MIIDSMIRDVTSESERTVNKIIFWSMLFAFPLLFIPAMFAQQSKTYK